MRLLICFVTMVTGSEKMRLKYPALALVLLSFVMGCDISVSDQSENSGGLRILNGDGVESAEVELEVAWGYKMASDLIFKGSLSKFVELFGEVEFQHRFTVDTLSDRPEYLVYRVKDGRWAGFELWTSPDMVVQRIEDASGYKIEYLKYSRPKGGSYWTPTGVLNSLR